MADLAAPPGAPPSPAAAPPTGPSPIAMPTQPGLVAGMRAKIKLAAETLIECLGMTKDIGTDEGKACLSALNALKGVVPEVTEGLSQSALQGMTAMAPAAPGPQRPQIGGALMPPGPRPAMMAGNRPLPMR